MGARSLVPKKNSNMFKQAPPKWQPNNPMEDWEEMDDLDKTLGKSLYLEDPMGQNIKQKEDSKGDDSD